MKDLGLPDDIMNFINYPTRFDCRQAQQALEGSGIAVPRLWGDMKSVVWRLFEFYQSRGRTTSAASIRSATQR